MKEASKIHAIEASQLVVDQEINLSLGLSKTDIRWKNKPVLWSDFLKRLQSPTITQETVAEYKKLPKARRDEIKDVGGFVGGFLKQGRRKAMNVQSRSIITLDADSGHKDLWEDMQLLANYCIAVYTTHSHTPAAPRYRFIIPLTRVVTPDEYEPIARKIADSFGINNFDDTTYQPERLMFWPSHPRDGEYLFDVINESWLDPDTILEQYVDWKDSSYWPESERSKGIRKSKIEKQGDPLEKSGVIGAFCRTYDIHRTIETFLPETYIATDKADRYTYVEGSTNGGLVIYDDKFAYSHHSTDPVGDQLVNAFDLVRIHKFGHLDEDVAPTTNITKYPSFQAMEDFAVKLDKVKKLIVKEKFDKAQEDFEGVEVQSDEMKEDDSWMDDLEIDKKGKVLATAHNLEVILRGDPNLRDRIFYDEFAIRVVVKKDLPWRKVKDDGNWKDSDDAGLRIYLENTYGIVAKGKIEDAVLQEMERNSYHPVREYLNSLEWDNVPRLDTLLIDYLGAEDNLYTRVVTRKFLVAAVARIFRPGVKFDNVLVTTGPQGIGKTLLPTKLAGDWFSNSLEDVRGKDALEAIQGVWIMEMGEMTATRKADVEATKHFVSKTEDQFRMAYGKRKSYFKRQCVFWGTSNDSDFLRDKTGNRRFWPVEVGTQPVKAHVWNMTEEIRGQVWAEAVSLLRAGEPLYLDEEQVALATEAQLQHTEDSAMQGEIEEYLEIPITENWYELSAQERRIYIQNYGDDLAEAGNVRRDKVCIQEILFERYGYNSVKAHPAVKAEIRNIVSNLDGWTRHNSGSGQLRFGPDYGRQRAYIRKDCEI